MKRQLLVFLAMFSLLGADLQQNLVVHHVKVEPVRDVTVQTRGSGEIVQILKIEGDFVKTGDPIIVLDDRKLKISVQQAESRLKTAQADFQRLRNSLEARIKSADLAIEQARRDLRLAQTQYLMQKELKEKDMVSELDFLLAEGRWESAKVRVAIAEQEAALAKLNAPNDVERALESVSQAHSALELSEITLSEATVRAPFDGVIQSLDIEKGQWLSAGDSVARIIDARRLRLTLDISVGHLEVIRQESWSKVQVNPEGHGNLVAEGKLASRSPIIDSASGTLSMTFEIDNQNGEIIPGGLAKVTLISEASELIEDSD